MYLFWWETFWFARQVKVQGGKKVLLQNTTSNAEILTLQRNKHFPSYSSLIRRVVSTPRWTKDGPNPSEMEMKVFVPAPTSHLTDSSFL